MESKKENVQTNNLNERRIIMNEFTTRIQNAIAATKELGKAGVIPENYYEDTVAQRSPKTGCGSIVTSFRGKEVFDGIGHLCFFDAWEGWKPYDNCPNLIPGCVAFRNDDLGGELGIVRLSDLDPKSEVTLDDRKHTGNVSATVSGIRGKYANFVVAILGVENGKEILFTFHPGDPCMPSKVKTEPGFHGRKVTVAEAMAMGLETAKIV